MIEICKWNDTFENADTRKRQRLKSFHSPSGIESRGLLNLLCHFDGKDALAAFGVFQLFCQISATMPAKQRGRLVHSDGKPMSPEFIARLLRVDICHLTGALRILTDERVRWIHIHDDSVSLPESCRSHPAFVQGEGEGEVEEEVEGEGEDGTHASVSPPAPSKTPPVRSDWSDRLPMENAKSMERIQAWINAMHPTWKRRPHFTRAEQEELLGVLKFVAEITDNDWRSLRAYMDVEITEKFINDHAAGQRFWQPDQRGQFVKSISDVLSHHDRWLVACRKAGITINLGGENP